MKLSEPERKMFGFGQGEVQDLKVFTIFERKS